MIVNSYVCCRESSLEQSRLTDQDPLVVRTEFRDFQPCGVLIHGRTRLNLVAQYCTLKHSSAIQTTEGGALRPTTRHRK